MNLQSDYDFPEELSILFKQKIIEKEKQINTRTSPS